LAYEGHWKDNNYGHWTTIPPATESAGSINSVKNGMLLGNTIHALFDGYDLSINPDVRTPCFRGVYRLICYRIITRSSASDTIERASPACISTSDILRIRVDRSISFCVDISGRRGGLREYEGAGVPVFEFDFPPGSDMGETMSGPRAGERMEFELFSRLVVD